MRRPDVRAVEQAVAEFDRIGRDAFMEKYGFADRNITYEVEVGGQIYPSKAIFGAAFGYMPEGTPRDSETCNGTEAREHLDRLGFRIVDRRVGQSGTQADRIRAFVIANIVEPARQRGEADVEIVSGDVHTRMGLENALPAVCNVLEGKIFAEEAKVALLDRHSPIGSDKPSSTIRYRFSLHAERADAFDRRALERLKAKFFERHPDFVSFDDSPSFAAMERDYKQAVVTEAQRLVAVMKDESDEALGSALIALLAGRAGLSCNLIDWRAQKVIDDVREAQPGLAERATGRLARAEDGAEAIIAYLDSVWPAMSEGRPSRPCAESRMFPTMLRALVAPGEVLPIRSSPTDHALRFLTGGDGFASAPLSRAELDRVNAMARQIIRVMDEEWGWHPRDMWDVQGFIWVTCRERHEQVPQANENEKDVVMDPTNLILYGPPGTGKTYRTMEVAVRLCGETPETHRKMLREQYDQLRKEKRIEFVTFHQNFSYEEFVEGLRPSTSSEDEEGKATAGFRLEPTSGIFRQLCTRADEARKARVTGVGLNIEGRNVFKMSLGRAGIEDDIFEDAWEGNYIVLGWGGDIDWSGFDSYQSIHDRWNLDHPGTHGSDSNIAQVNRFVVDMKPGDLVLVSYGNTRIRAIAEVIGDYEYEPTETRDYNHRRRVRWLRRFDTPIDASLVSSAKFSQKSCYKIREANLDRDGLATLLPSEASVSGEVMQFVLIIDEINRANVSKVFGELITLIEPDKRLGGEEELTVKLPYSNDLFGVPANLHIIGTMNTADRSIALLDTALRRRFRFEEIAPEPELLGKVDGIDLAEVLTAMNRRIEYLVDRDHRIGHAFFIDCETKADVDAAMRDKVIPLLQEYFFDDWNRLAAVLGEKKDKGGNFLDCEKLYDPTGEGRDPINSWRVRQSFDEGAYDRLIAGASAQPSEAEGEV